MRSCGPVRSLACPHVPLLNGLWSCWGLCFVVGLRNRGEDETRSTNVGLKQASFLLASFLPVTACCGVRVPCGAWGLEVGSAGFEPAKAEPLDLQSSPFDRSGNFPHVLVISVLTQISPNQNLPRERHRFFRSGATASSDQFPLRISHSEAVRAENDHRIDDQDNDRHIPRPDAIDATGWKCFRPTATIGGALPPGIWSELAAGVEPATT